MQLSASLVFLSLGLVMGQQSPLCNGAPVQRKSLNQMSQPEIDAFVAAVKAVSNDPANKWGEFAKLHAEVYQSVHVNPKFLPWHRIFLRKMEQLLQEKNPSVTIPYWDWAQYSQNPENDPIFTDRIAGGDGNPGDNDCISNGQFADLKVDYTANQSSNTRCIKRRMTKKDANGLVWTSTDTIDGHILNSQSFKDFTESLEQGSHGIIHNCIGSEFAGHASPNDPIFYLHHGFIDKIWYDWQKRNPQLALTYSDDINATLERLGATVADALDSEKLCVRYPEDRFKWSTSQQSQQATSASQAPQSTAAPVASAATTTVDAPIAATPTPNDSAPQPIPSQPVADQSAVVQPPVPTNTQAAPTTTTIAAIPTTTAAPITTTIAPIAPQPNNNGTAPILNRRGYSVKEAIVPEIYSVKCRNKESRARYDAWYVNHDIEAPSADDRKDLYKIRVPSQLDADFIKRWGFNHTFVRELERKNALYIHKLNKDPNHISPDALINSPKFNPALKKDCGCNKSKNTTTGYPVAPIATTTTGYPVKPTTPVAVVPTTTSAYPVKPIATTTEAYPVKPIATTTTEAYPVKTTTTEAYPVKPIATTTTGAYPVKPIATTTAAPAYPIKQY